MHELMHKNSSILSQYWKIPNFETLIFQKSIYWSIKQHNRYKKYVIITQLNNITSQFHPIEQNPQFLKNT